MSILQVFLFLVGAFLAAFVILILLGWAWVRYKLRTWAKKFEEEAGKYAALAPVMPSFRLHLQPNTDCDWQHAEEVDAIGATIIDNGFELIGDFEVEEAPLLLRAFANPKECVYAVVYEHYTLGYWFDLTCFYNDGRVFTCSTAKTTGLARPPFVMIENHPGAKPQELLEHCLATRPPGERQPASRHQFKTQFESNYAREMDWRDERGGPSEDEIRSIAASTDEEEVRELVVLARGAWQAQVREQLNEELRSAYFEHANLSARRWEEIRERLVFAHDRLETNDLLDLWEPAFFEQLSQRTSAGDDDDEFDGEIERRRDDLSRKIAGLSGRQGFAKINETLARKFCYEKIGEVSHPLPADVYLEPVRAD